MLGELAKVPSAQSREEHCPEKVAQNGGADVENGDEVSTVEMDRIYR